MKKGINHDLNRDRCALIIYLFGYLDSPNYHGIAWAAKMICHRLTKNQHN